MRNLIFIIILTFLPVQTAANERDALYGTWGTEKQCTRAPILPGSLVQSEPFEINAQWLKRGPIWCKLDWFPIENRSNGFFTGANAICGEDTVQDYMLGMELTGDELTIRWDFTNKHGPLKLCKSK